MHSTWKLQPWKAFGLLASDVVDPMFFQGLDAEKVYRRKVNTVFGTTIALILAFAALIWVIISIRWDINSLGISEFENWFAPSGAVLVLTGVFLEWRIKGIINYRQTHAEGGLIDEGTTTGQAFLRWLAFIEKICIFWILVGTAIWAYGDKFVCFLIF